MSMPPTPMTLTHCVETPLPGAGPGTLVITTTGGQGRIDVIEPGQPPLGHVHVPPGGKVPVPAGPVHVHYHADPGGPPTVSVTVEII